MKAEESATNKSQNAVERLANDLMKYVELQLEYQRINSSEKIAAAASFIISVLVVVLIFLFAFIFVIVSFAVILSYYTSWAIGFGVLAIICLCLCIGALLFRKKLIEKPMFELAAGAILDSIENKDHENA